MNKRAARTKAGFTLIETLVAILLLTVAIVAPLSLTTQSLATAYYARDQITAYYLAQEGIEVVRAVRDGNILKVAIGQSANLLDNIPDTTGKPFTVNTIPLASQSMQLCPSSSSTSCPPLQIVDLGSGNTMYGYQTGSPNSRFTRYVEVTTLTSVAGVPEEVRVSSTVSWQTGNITRSFTISEDMYRWVKDNS